jgi:hypothetical protein
MKGGFYKIALIQLLFFLSYDLLLYTIGFASLLLFAILMHAICLLVFSIINFKKKESSKAFGFLIPFFLVLLIGTGSCTGLYADMSANTFESYKDRLDHNRKRRLEKHGDTAREMGTKPNKHKGQKQSGIPGGRYKWLKKKRKKSTSAVTPVIVGAQLSPRFTLLHSCHSLQVLAKFDCENKFHPLWAFRCCQG